MATVGVAALLGMVGMGATALVTATPASAAAVNQEFAFRIPLFGGSLGYTGVVISSNWSASAASVSQGSNFTFHSAPTTTVVPTTSSGFTLLDIHDTFNYYPIPAGTTFVSAVASGPVSFTPVGGTATTSPLTVKYCPTTTTPGCTADPTNLGFPNNFLGHTPAPYLEAGTQAGLKFAAGGSLTTPGLTVTLKGTTGGTTANWTQTEFKTTSDITLGAVTVLGYPSNAPIPPTFTSSMALLNPPPTLASTSIAGTASVSAVLPNSGPLAGGTQVKVIGQFLDNPTSVTFGGKPAANVIPLTSDSLLATAPAGSAGPVDVQVTTALSGSPPNGVDKFTYTAGPIVTGISPSVGPPAGGTSVTITGLQLTGATAVHFGTTAAATTANTATSITATAPPGTGVVDVTVTAGGKTSTISQQDRFSYLAGYLLAAADGGVFAYGSAPFNGSAGGSPLNKPVVGIASTPDGAGYWLVAADGGVFAFGDAQFFGSMGGTHINKPVVGIATTPNGGGYWLTAADGGIFAFGDAPFAGSQGANPLNAPVVGISATSTGKGYWMTAADGGVFNEGDATFAGSAGGAPLNKPVVGIVGSGTSAYLLTASDGGVFNYGGTYYGSAGGIMLNKPVVGIAAT